jgi:hypothetical protein
VLTRTELQDGIDAATLTAARSGKSDNAALKAVGLPALRAHLKRGQAGRRLKDDDVSFVRTAGQVTGQVKVCVDPIVSGLLGVPSSCLTASADVKREDVGLEVVLVLDSSGSMESWSPSAGMKRIDALEVAAKEFIDKLQTLDNPALADDVRVGLVPYAGTVRLAPSNRGQWWLDTAGGSSVNTGLFHSMVPILKGDSSAVSAPRRFDLFDSLGIAWSGCVESRPGVYGVDDDPPVAGQPDSLFVPYFAPDELDMLGSIQPTKYPNSYIGDRTDETFPINGQYRKLNDNERTDLYAASWKELQYVVDKYARTNVNGTMTPPALTVPATEVAANNKGPNRWCKTDRVWPLTNDFSGLKSELDVIPTTRHTNIAMGLMWGWHVLAPFAPFNNAKAYKASGVTKVVVLLTDGHSYLDPPGPMEGEDPPNKNESYYNGLGYVWRGRLGPGVGLGSSHNQRLAALDTQMQTICDGMRREGVVIYTIQLEAGSTNNQRLVSCSGADNFKNVTQAGELNSVFQRIADNISELRLAK